MSIKTAGFQGNKIQDRRQRDRHLSYCAQCACVENYVLSLTLVRGDLYIICVIFDQLNLIILQNEKFLYSNFMFCTKVRF